MSRFSGRDFNLRSIPTGGVITDVDERHPPPNPPQRASLNQVATQSESDSRDGSGVSFSMYLERSSEEIRMEAIRKADIDGLIVFAALLASTVAIFTGVSVQGLKPDPRDVSAFYLAKAYHHLANAKGVPISVPATVPPDPSNFSPSRTIVWVNVCWFLSLAVSLTCILLALSPQQWARRYSNVASQLRSAYQGRITGAREFAGAGVEELNVVRFPRRRLSPGVLRTLSTLLRISHILFFAGIAILLFILTADFGIAQSFILTTASVACPVLCFWHTI
ncbi:hypothetical protein B0F90DRAFT_306958 [Multifurca ochricompacta]|uniref:DUF6535 domain-containing protein n=1 Tax=Multifurca ochricompacta TaxID=376703 RepID=A0AAD4M5N5_9AGAM|nr:hypothetical protein B0F90DRAFT_306958 [Multifurca ochricompacta]